MVSLTTNNLNGGYDDNKVFENLCIKLPEKGVTAIAGPNGAGKSTLLKYFIKQLKGSQGAVLLDGTDILEMKQDEVAQKVSFVGQNSLATSGFTVRETVSMGRFCHSDNDIEAVEKAIDACGIRQIADKSISRLSGGELQMTMLARAICQDAPAMLLDEPVNNLDPYHQVTLMKMLRSIAAQGRTVICVLHDLNAVLTYCDNCILMRGGNVFANGSTRDIVNESNISMLYNLECKIIEDPETGPHIAFI